LVISKSTLATGRHGGYRADIDGLRAVSILAVVLYHAFPQSLGSGYIGVDVFFVISGYLIGGLVTGELADGSFSFARFYARRVRRLFPALIIVLAFVLVVGWHMMFPEEFYLLGRHVLAAALFVSNFQPMGEIGYFGTDAHSKPLLHLWSLGIEEQFYLVWPVLAVLTRRSRRLFLFLTAAAVVVSLGLSITSDAPSIAFYEPWTRFWELAVGVLAAHLPDDIATRWRRAAGLRDVACAVGLGMILGTAMAPDLNGFPGAWATLPVGGAVLVIASGPDTFIGRRVLASRPLVFIGKISYPLYLWHWPLLAFTWIACGSFPPLYLVQIMVVASFVLAWLTYVLVERPTRFLLPARGVVALCIPLMILLGIAGAMIRTFDGVPDRRVVLENMQLAADIRPPLSTTMSNGSCEKPYGIHAAQDFACQVSSPQPVMLVIGDSIAMAFHSAITLGLVSADSAFVATPSPNWAAPGCLTTGPLEAWSKGDLLCQRVVRDALLILDKTPSIKVVVVPTFSDSPFFDDPDRLRALQDAVVGRGRKLVYVAAPPAFFRPPEGCRPRHVEIAGMDLTAPSDIGSCQEARTLIEKTLQKQHDIFSKMAAATSGVVLFETLPAFCDSTTCYQSDSAGPLYWSWGHVNARGSVRLLASFLPWLKSNVLVN
jgi:peptidoglycan/LPS O-acetylase OafA/YrhL